MSKTEMPSIRFYGFDNDWEQRKLEDYLTVSAEKTLATYMVGLMFCPFQATME